MKVEEAREEERGEAETVAVVKAGEMAVAAKEVEEKAAVRVAAATVGAGTEAVMAAVEMVEVATVVTTEARVAGATAGR